MANKISKNKIPSKRRINLAHIGEESINWALAVPGIILIVVLAVIFSKFAVADRFAKLSQKRSEANAIEKQRDDYYEMIGSLGEIDLEYAHYSYDNFTEDELGMVDRVEVLSLIDEVVLSKADVNSWSLSGNVLQLNIEGITLDEVSVLSQNLEDNRLVRYCMVSTAQTNDGYNTGNQNVRAVMTVYLSIPETEENDAIEDGGDE